jgi:hypothetical protein
MRKKRVYSRNRISHEQKGFELFKEDPEWGCSSVVKQLPSMHKALIQSPVPQNKQTNKQKTPEAD